jgi:hypothetical protein
VQLKDHRYHARVGRDAAHALADAERRETLHSASEERAALAADQTALLVEMLRQNTQLTETVKALIERVGALTPEVHKDGGQFADCLKHISAE